MYNKYPTKIGKILQIRDLYLYYNNIFDRMRLTCYTYSYQDHGPHFIIREDLSSDNTQPDRTLNSYFSLKKKLADVCLKSNIESVFCICFSFQAHFFNTLSAES